MALDDTVRYGVPVDRSDSDSHEADEVRREWRDEGEVRDAGVPDPYRLTLAQVATKAMIDEWLSGKHSTLWGDAFTIHNHDERARAVEWFYAQLCGFYSHMYGVATDGV